jgi:hypothetical protein
MFSILQRILWENVTRSTRKNARYQGLWGYGVSGGIFPTTDLMGKCYQEYKGMLGIRGYGVMGFHGGIFPTTDIMGEMLPGVPGKTLGIRGYGVSWGIFL